jgi:hypothetical protein
MSEWGKIQYEWSSFQGEWDFFTLTDPNNTP